jgi:Uma2 family endonuclease
MSTAIAEITSEPCVLLENISWETYEALLEEIGEQQIRLTYDDGRLEIMTMSLGHEGFGCWIGRLIYSLTLELDIPIKSGGSTTLKRKFKKKGLEPDECYWIQNEEVMRGKQEFDIKTDPPPDLAVEVDKASSSLDRMPIYAALKVPELWRFDGERLRVYRLQKDKYRETKRSPTFPFLPLDKMTEFILQSTEQEENNLLRAFVRWIREDIVPVR